MTTENEKIRKRDKEGMMIKHNIKLTQEEMFAIIEVFEHYDQYPCRKKIIWKLPDKLRKIIREEWEEDEN